MLQLLHTFHFRTSLELVDDCMPQKSSNLALAVQLANVHVQLKNSKDYPDNEDNWIAQQTATKKDMGSILSNIALRDDYSGYYDDKTTSGSYSLSKPRNSRSQNFLDGHLSPLEIGMYVLVAVLCAAMAVFMASCFVYASKYRKAKYPVHTGSHPEAALPAVVGLDQTNKSRSSVQNAPDWIWFGNRTFDNSGTGSESSHRFQSSHHSAAEINVISNPVEERIPLHQLHSMYPRQQFCMENNGQQKTYENLPILRRSRSRLPQIPIDGASNSGSSAQNQNTNSFQRRKRRLLPQINTATYTKVRNSRCLRNVQLFY